MEVEAEEMARAETAARRAEEDTRRAIVEARRREEMKRPIIIG